MKSAPAVLLAILALSVPCSAQQALDNHHMTRVPDDSRYELIQSQVAAKITLRLDKFTGEVFQLAESLDLTESGYPSLVWQRMKRDPHPDDTPVPDRVNYQIFTSGLGVRFTFLINVNSGAVWQLVEDRERVLSWQPVMEVQP